MCCEGGRISFGYKREQLSSKWIDGFEKNLLRALFIRGTGEIGQRIMDFATGKFLELM